MTDRIRIEKAKAAARAALRHACDVTLAKKRITSGHCKPILAAATSGGEADVRLGFCVACGSKNDLQHRHLVTKTEVGSDDERITLCTSCHDKLHRQRYGAVSTVSASRRHLPLDGRAEPASADRRS